MVARVFLAFLLSFPFPGVGRYIAQPDFKLDCADFAEVSDAPKTLMEYLMALHKFMLAARPIEPDRKTVHKLRAFMQTRQCTHPARWLQTTLIITRACVDRILALAPTDLGFGRPVALPRCPTCQPCCTCNKRTLLRYASV